MSDNMDSSLDRSVNLNYSLNKKVGSFSYLYRVKEPFIKKFGKYKLQVIN